MFGSVVVVFCFGGCVFVFYCVCHSGLNWLFLVLDVKRLVKECCVARCQLSVTGERCSGMMLPIQ